MDHLCEKKAYFTHMKFKYWLPFITWVVPTIIITIILGMVDAPLTQAQTIGFTALVLSAGITYYLGIRQALKDK